MPVRAPRPVHRVELVHGALPEGPAALLARLLTGEEAGGARPANGARPMSGAQSANGAQPTMRAPGQHGPSTR
ncbi:hypothetical protein GCM10009639_18530 [Kitasatospora putterlickiae]|uniref:Uncharacterized protein n=1 Tax=Kitasatospora putterlickiae TaxID=221725 RepID=A0ABN1XTY7_9ACTN